MYQCILCVNSKIRKGILKRLIFNPQTLSFISVGASIQKMLMILKKVLLLYATELLYIVETNRR